MSVLTLQTDLTAAAREVSYGPQERTHALQQTPSQFNQFVGAGVALLGRLALTVTQNLGIAAEPIHDCGRDEFDTR
jgi:hypothetical protein